MDTPTLLWNHKLENGQILAEFVGGNAPSRLPQVDATSLSEIWRNRLVDARNSNRKDLEGRAESILRFLSHNASGVCLLLWPKHRISALVEESTGEFVLIDETTPS